MCMFKSNRQTAYAIMTENKGSFIIMVSKGINQIIKPELVAHMG
jgi:hypothetical protein